MVTQTPTDHRYYIPTPVPWPILLTASLVITIIGGSVWMNGAETIGPIVLVIGVVLIVSVASVWLRAVVNESLAGVYSRWEDRTFRYAMTWFIFSEVMFFGAFFGALFYAHVLSVPWLAGDNGEFYTHFYLWPSFAGGWPSNGPLNMGGDFSTVAPWRIPFLNTILLLSSSVTVTWAHWGLKAGKRVQLYLGLAATIALGVAFLYFQATEFMEAYLELGLTLGSGIYGSTFFMLTGFHGLHVTFGAIMLSVILLRSLKGHFNPHDHFAFEGVSWYWHFVDVVWLNLFVFVYIL